MKVSPEAQSTPKRAAISPAGASSMSSILFACMRMRRPTRNLRRLRVLYSSLPLRIVPW